MENLHYNLSEEEFSKSRKILLWIFASLFFLGGIYVVLAKPVFGILSINPALSLAPFGISLLVGSIAALATIKRKDLYFLIDDEKIEFRYGLIKPKKYSFPWNSINKMIMSQKERKVKVVFTDGSTHVIDLSYIQRKKSSIIRKHLYHATREKNLVVEKVMHLKK